MLDESIFFTQQVHDAPGTSPALAVMAHSSVASTLGHIPDDEAWHRTIILPRDILDNPPSGEHDVDWETESGHRIWGCELLQEAGILLRCVMQKYGAFNV